MGLYTEDEYKTKIVGVTFKNDDGTNRQDIIESCTEGESLSLEHYYFKDEDAFKVTNVYGEVLGNLKKELTERLTEKYDPGTIEAADVEILNITGEDKGTLGVNIKITITDLLSDDSDGNIIFFDNSECRKMGVSASFVSYAAVTATFFPVSLILHHAHTIKQLIPAAFNFFSVFSAFLRSV